MRKGERFGRVKFEILLVNSEDLLSGKLDVQSRFQGRRPGWRF